MNLHRLLIVGVTVVLLTVVAGQWYLVVAQRNSSIGLIDGRINGIVSSAGPADSGGQRPLSIGVLVAKYTEDTGLVVAIPLAGQPDLIPVLPPGFESREAPFTVETAGGTSRVRLRVGVSRSGDTTRVVGFSLAEVDAATATLRRNVLVSLAVTASTLLFISVIVNRLALRPLRSMTVTATDLASNRGDGTIPDFPPGTEAAELSSAIGHLVHQKNLALGQTRRFVADASHELRTPLTTIVGYASLHAAGHLDGEEARADALTRIGQASNQMSRIVDGLVQLALLDEHPRLDIETIDLDLLVATVVDAFAGSHVGNMFTVEVSGEPLHIKSDPTRLNQALTSLLSNAVHHNPPETTVSVRSARHGHRWVIEVADDGIGIAPGHLDRIFDRFYRVDRRSGHGRSGGLGLSIVESIVELLGGEITVRSVEGEGTTFRIEAPIVPE